MSSYAEPRRKSGAWGFITFILILAAVITIIYTISIQPTKDSYYSTGDTNMQKCKVCKLYSTDLYDGKCPNCRNLEKHKPKKGK